MMTKVVVEYMCGCLEMGKEGEATAGFMLQIQGETRGLDLKERRESKSLRFTYQFSGQQCWMVPRKCLWKLETEMKERRDIGGCNFYLS